LNWVFLGTGILLVVAILLEFLKGLHVSGNSLVYLSYVAAKFLLGELALWFIIVGWRSKYFAKLNKFSIRWGADSGLGYKLMAVYLILVALNLFQIVPVGREAYDALPQAYGGGRPLRVELYVDANKVPGELLITKSDVGQNSPARTVSLNLVLQTSAEYVVDPLDDGSQRAWVLKADAVHAVHIIEASLP
jgi:hypothetical protein